MSSKLRYQRVLLKISGEALKGEREFGYDPAAVDLPDFCLRIDFREALLYLRITDWQDEYIYSLYE